MTLESNLPATLEGVRAAMKKLNDTPGFDACMAALKAHGANCISALPRKKKGEYECVDMKRADVLLVNLLGLKKLSLGAIKALAWAVALQKPAVVAIEKSGNPHDNHPLLSAAMMPFRVETLDQAIESTAIILNRTIALEAHS